MSFQPLTVPDDRRAARQRAAHPQRREPLDAEDLGRLFQKLAPRMRVVAQRITRDREAARDIVQSAFERAYLRRQQFRGNAQPSTWLHRIVVNEALMWLRRERRRPALAGSPLDADTTLPDEAPGPGALLLRRELRLRVGDGLAALGTEDRNLLRATVLEGRSHAEIGRELRLRPAAVKSRAFRARRRLRDLLTERGVGAEG